MKDKKLENFIDTLQSTNIRISDIVDVKKVLKDVESVKINLYTLNYIISNTREEMINRIKILYQKDSKVFFTLPLLIAFENNREIFENNISINIDEYLSSLDNIISFFDNSGLFELILKGKLQHFNDYLLGIKVGLDSNARKNRFGTRNEKDIKQIIEKEFSKYKDLTLQYQIKGKDIENVNQIENLINKKFDVLIKNNSNNKTILIESSFYNTQGSKLTETSRSYKKIFEDFESLGSYYLFIWVVDGKGVKSIENEIESKFHFDYIFNKSGFIEKIKTYLELN